MRLKEARTNKGLTQKELAAVLGVQPTTYNQWETGKRQPDPETLKRIADTLDVSVDYLIGRDAVSTVTEDQIKVALFGGDGEVTDEMWEEVKRFAAFVKENENKKRNG